MTFLGITVIYRTRFLFSGFKKQTYLYFYELRKLVSILVSWPRGHFLASAAISLPCSSFPLFTAKSRVGQERKCAPITCGYHRLGYQIVCYSRAQPHQRIFQHSDLLLPLFPKDHPRLIPLYIFPVLLTTPVPATISW